jgi:iron complex outermembrane receptor protein
VNVLLSSAEGGRVFNAGKAIIWGAEAETSLLLAKNTHFNASVNYLNAELKKMTALYNVYCVPTSEGGAGNCKTPTGDDLTSVGDLDPATPGVQAPSYAGNRPGYSPKWILTGGLDHSWDIGSKGTLTARINTTYKTTYFTNFLNYPDVAQKPFSSTDLSLEYQGFNGITVSAYVRNLEDYRPLTQSYFLAAATDDIYNWEFGTPRTYGVRVGYKF